MRRYNSYKKSTFDWMGEIPSHWVLTKNRYGFQKNSNGKNESDETPVLSLTTKGVKVKTNLSFGKSTESYIGHQLVEKGDIVFTPRDFDQTPILSDVSNFFGCISNLYIVDKTKGNVLNHYVNYYWYGLKYSVDYFKNFSHGMRYSFNRFQFDEIPLLLPPLSEQKQIVSYLDTKTTLIDSLIEKTYRKIELLKEKRTSLINEVVTKGLNPNVEMKDSGVEWIGEIPSGWEKSKLKYKGFFFSGYSFDSNDFLTEGEIRVLKISNVQNNGISWDDLQYLPEVFFDTHQNFRVNKGDLVFVLTRPIISTGIKVCFFEEDYRTLLNQRNSVFRPNESEVVKRFLYYSVRTFSFGEEFKQQLKETNQPNISTEQISNILMFFPPISEQQQIVSYLDEHTQLIDKTISVEERRIDTLKEYRQSLISEVVTGKRKVVTYE
jgi:type I restriction enzyme S subunit